MSWIVVKLGGDVLEGDRLAAVARGLAGAGATDRRFVVVHGGGAQVTELAARFDLPTQMIGGRRVTDQATVDVMKMVVAGRLNVELCVALQAAGVAAVGLHAGAGVVRATRRPPRVVSGGPSHPVDLGLVGDVIDFDVALIETLAGAGRVPVLSCLGLARGETDAVLNVNADLVASRLAADLGAIALVAVTQVGGVRRDRHDPSTRIARLTVDEARAEIAEGRVQGGMIPKLEEAFVPLGAGVGAVHIVGPDEIATSLANPGSAGTVMLV